MLLRQILYCTKNYNYEQSLYSWKASSKGWVIVKYPNYKVEINNGVQFIFSITYMEMSQEISENVSVNSEMSQEISENVCVNSEMSQETYVELIDEDLNISLNLGNSGCISE